MITVKVTFGNGNSLVAGINAYFEGAEDYYLGKWFNLGCVDDDMQKAIKVELVQLQLLEACKEALELLEESRIELVQNGIEESNLHFDEHIIGCLNAINKAEGV